MGNPESREFLGEMPLGSVILPSYSGNRELKRTTAIGIQVKAAAPPVALRNSLHLQQQNRVAGDPAPTAARKEIFFSRLRSWVKHGCGS